MKMSYSIQTSALLFIGMACASCPLLAQGKSFLSTGAGKGTAAAATPVHPFTTDIRDGILTVDGMVAKVHLNYNVDKGYLYFTIPGVGTAIVAQDHFTNALPQKQAFHENTLTFSANGHTVQLTSATPIVGKGREEAWVAIDPLFGAGKYPQMGFGDTLARPYVWPGALPESAEKKRGESDEAVVPPPVPVSLLPRPAITSSYTVVVPGTDPGKK